ncbi:MAG: SDR family oxidoreductase [Ilumatobacter sp.]|uniref:UDP-glucuronic acid decarboxylase family protein n=1 Tax=Ilumatobacter sp. TaxID=1967498 RepID=UPI002611C187|nr:UDP-glucuronic acid decarboxylase family protein [Ilumatobacter sp.]MDJ0768713.1 SDR family oxidoreductase [Ilumatobacter sp.]
MTGDRHVVVAGGAGFLGSHFCDRLLDRGDHVICVDNFSTGRRTNIEHLAGHDRFRSIDHDVVQPGLDAQLDRVDGVVNLASPASPPEYLRRPIDTLDVGSIGTHRLLDLAVERGARFFLASTSEVYGDPLVHPQPEHYWGNVNPIGERSVYDEAKRFAEALTMAYHRSKSLDVRIVRIFNTYGPRMQADDGRVVSNLVNQALRGEPLTIYGDGSQTRSFCFVDDEIEGLLAVLDGPLAGPVNVGNPNEFTMLELADLVLELTGSSSQKVFRDLPSDDPKVRRPDITIASEQLGWSPAIDLRTGLERTIEWFRSAVHR